MDPIGEGGVFVNRWRGFSILYDKYCRSDSFHPLITFDDSFITMSTVLRAVLMGSESLSAHLGRRFDHILTTWG